MSVLGVAAIIVGIGVLVLGAELLVRGAGRLAASAGVPPLLVGLTVVAFGTSAPELVVSVHAAVSGASEVAIGNAVGSNVFNSLAILGVSALVGGLVVHRRLVRIDVPILLAVTAAVWWMAADGEIGAGEGGVLLSGIVAYTVLAYLLARRERRPVADVEREGAAPPRALVSAALVLLGLVALVGGAQLLVMGATQLATDLGVSALVIGLTVVAVGTSLPELATSVVATRRGERDIAVGNIVGSNVFNLLAVNGLAAVSAGGLSVPATMIDTDLPMLLLATLVVALALSIGRSVSRWEGGVLLLGYAGYTAYLVIEEARSAAAPGARLWLLCGFAGAALLVGLAGWRSHRRTD